MGACGAAAAGSEAEAGAGDAVAGPGAAEEQLEQLVSLVVSLVPGAGAAAGSCSPCS